MSSTKSDDSNNSDGQQQQQGHNSVDFGGLKFEVDFSAIFGYFVCSLSLAICKLGLCLNKDTELAPCNAAQEQEAGFGEQALQRGQLRVERLEGRGGQAGGRLKRQQ